MLQQFYVLVAGLVVQATACSYDDSSLLDWNTNAAWDDGVPGEREVARIKTGRHVRLNITTPKLKGVIIESDASLVWGNYDDIVLTTDYIHVQGTLTVGDSDCPFTKKANIKLTGKSNSGNVLENFGRKVIGVDEGGTIELHGAVKRSWTKLIQTMPSARDVCGFNFKKSDFNAETGKGLFVMVFNLDGSVFDFSVFKTENKADDDVENLFESFIEDIPDDKILMIVVNSDFGTGTVTRDWKKIYNTVQTVGGLDSTLLKKVQGREAYAFITKTGNHSSTKEDYAGNPGDADFLSSKWLRLHDTTNDMVFSVRSTVAPTGGNKGTDILVLTYDVAFPKIKLNDNVNSWVAGDQIVVASTDFEWRQVEEFKLLDCKNCAENEVQLDHPFEYMHYGEITHNVDEMAEVGLLTRSIKIEGVMEDECYAYDEIEQSLCDKFNEDTHGGEVQINRGFTAAHIEHVELENMGQQKVMGAYALHFHMCDDAEGNWFRNNSIHKCHSRCVTIHGTDKSEASHNVCFKTKGHSFFYEDSAEQWNIWDGNLVIGTSFGTHLLSDMHKDWVNQSMRGFANALASYWITHPNNYIRNNVAAGSDNSGFWIIPALEPLRESEARQVERKLVPKYHALHSPILEFDNNVAHSSHGRGLRADGRLANNGGVIPENGVMAIIPANIPRDPPNPDGALSRSVLKRLRTYKNKNQNVWVKAGTLIMEEFTLADSPRSMAAARADLGTYTEIKNSLFIGETDNKGLPEEPFGRSLATRADEALQGIEFYQGPIYVTDCFFDKFTHMYSDDTTRVAGAISFKRDATYPSSANSGVRNISFGFCETFNTNYVFQGNTTVGDFGNTDGNRHASFHDYDGSVTGTAGTQVVQRDPFFMTDRCLNRTSWGPLAVCPYEYARVLFEGSGGVFKTKDDDWAMSMRRDDIPDKPFQLSGIRKDNYLVLKNMSYTAYFNGTAPDTIKLTYQNLETYDYVRIGLCLPKDSEFTISRGYPRITRKEPAIEVDSIEKLDADKTGRAYFWDKARGLLFVHGIGVAERESKGICPGDRCIFMEIERTGSKDSIDCSDDAYGPYKKDTDTTTTIPQASNSCTTGTPAGYGAPAIPPKYPTEKFVGTCATKPTYPDITSKGCYKDDSNYPDLPHDRVDLIQSLSVEFCAQRCYQRNYAYAALQNGRLCSCGNLYGGYEETPEECTKQCPMGEGDMKCGESRRNSVYSTGRALLPDQTTCGADSSGVVINNRCYLLTSNADAYTGAQRSCVKLGGNLATITSKEIQFEVERYLRPKMESVWFGLNDISDEGTRQYVDGTEVPDFDDTQDGQGSSSNEDGFLLEAKTLYKWNDKPVTQSYKGLCEGPVSLEPPSGESCGENDAGKKFGSGSCYAVLNDELTKEMAEYACFTRMGTLVKVDDNNRDEVLKHVYFYGTGKNYWTADEDSNNNPYMLDYDKLYEKSSSYNNHEHGAVCKLDILSSSQPCGTGWKKNGNYCYFYRGDSVGSYDEARSLCKHGESDLVSIQSETENTFITTLAEGTSGSHAFLGYTYNSATSAFEWVDGSTGSYKNWMAKHGPHKSGKGTCSKIKLDGGKWKNQKCNAGADVMCKAPAAQ